MLIRVTAQYMTNEVGKFLQQKSICNVMGTDTSVKNIVKILQIPRNFGNAV